MQYMIITGNFLFKGDKRKCLNCNISIKSDLDTSKINNFEIPKIKNKKKIFFQVNQHIK